MKPVAQRARAVEGKISQVLRAVSVCAALLFASPAQGAPLAIPVAIGTPTPITDEFGVNLRGSATGPDTGSDLVQVLWATNGIEPPDVEGMPSANNPPVTGGDSHVGNLTAPDLVDAGLFSIALFDPRPPENSKIFVRVFNAPTLAGASFYADSQVLTVSGNANLYVNITATTNPLDPGDIDNDGLNNSWEKSLGANPENPDTDGDGMIDGDEHRAGTGATDSNSVFVAVWIQPDANANAFVSWESVAAKRYQVDGMAGPETDPVCYTNVSGVIRATDVVTETTITNGLLSGMGKFRVRLVEE